MISEEFRNKISPFHAFQPTPLHARDRSIEGVLSESEWQNLEIAHVERIDLWMVPQLDRRSRHEPDPVSDFIFEYYPFRPSQLRRWTPGTGIVLEGGNAGKFLTIDGFVKYENGVFLDTDRFPERLVKSTRWIRDMLVSTRDSQPHFGCSGMHEWAMVYGTSAPRHQKTPLRLSRAAINTLVEESVLSCTHYDAFRFFAGAASEMNINQLDRTTMAESEQPACLHTNMDLYRWAMKRSPWISSDLIADTFFLAIEIREIDMRASPYDFSSRGLKSIPVETPNGKREYLFYQKTFMDRAARLRIQLIGEYDGLLEAIG